MTMCIPIATVTVYYAIVRRQKNSMHAQAIAYMALSKAR